MKGWDMIITLPGSLVNNCRSFILLENRDNNKINDL